MRRRRETCEETPRRNAGARPSGPTMTGDTGIVMLNAGIDLASAAALPPEEVLKRLDKRLRPVRHRSGRPAQAVWAERCRLAPGAGAPRALGPAEPVPPPPPPAPPRA